MNSPAVKIIPIFKDNYIFALEDKHPTDPSSRYVIVDPGESATLIKNLSLKPNSGVKLKILITHHHHDHTDGLKDLMEKFDCEVWGPKMSQTQIPQIHHGLVGGETLCLGSFEFQVMALPGHTLDHLAFHESKLHWLFSGDVLFRYGCGRLFEADFATGYASLQKIKDLPLQTLIFCTHEYTLRNIEFALHWAELTKNSTRLKVLNEQKTAMQRLRKQNQPTIPFPLETDLTANPFLLAQSLNEFKEARQERNKF